MNKESIKIVLFTAAFAFVKKLTEQSQLQLVIRLKEKSDEEKLDEEKSKGEKSDQSTSQTDNEDWSDLPELEDDPKPFFIECKNFINGEQCINSKLEDYCYKHYEQYIKNVIDWLEKNNYHPNGMRFFLPKDHDGHGRWCFGCLHCCIHHSEISEMSGYDHIYSIYDEIYKRMGPHPFVLYLKETEKGNFKYQKCRVNKEDKWIEIYTNEWFAATHRTGIPMTREEIEEFEEEESKVNEVLQYYDQEGVIWYHDVKNRFFCGKTMNDMKNIVYKFPRKNLFGCVCFKDHEMDKIKEHIRYLLKKGVEYEPIKREQKIEEKLKLESITKEEESESKVNKEKELELKANKVLQYYEEGRVIWYHDQKSKAYGKRERNGSISYEFPDKDLYYGAAWFGENEMDEIKKHIRCLLKEGMKYGPMKREQKKNEENKSIKRIVPKNGEMMASGYAQKGIIAKREPIYAYNPLLGKKELMKDIVPKKWVGEDKSICYTLFGFGSDGTKMNIFCSEETFNKYNNVYAYNVKLEKKDLMKDIVAKTWGDYYTLSGIGSDGTLMMNLCTKETFDKYNDIVTKREPVYAYNDKLEKKELMKDIVAKMWGDYKNIYYTLVGVGSDGTKMFKPCSKKTFLLYSEK